MKVYGSLAKYGVAGQGTGTFGTVQTDATLAWVGAPLVANTTRNDPIATPIAVPWLEFGGRGSDSYALNVPPGHAPNPPVGNAYNGHVVVRVNNYGLGIADEGSTNFISASWFERSN